MWIVSHVRGPAVDFFTHRETHGSRAALRDARVPTVVPLGTAPDGLHHCPPRPHIPRVLNSHLYRPPVPLSTIQSFLFIQVPQTSLPHVTPAEHVDTYATQLRMPRKPHRLSSHTTPR